MRCVCYVVLHASEEVQVDKNLPDFDGTSVRECGRGANGLVGKKSLRKKELRSARLLRKKKICSRMTPKGYQRCKNVAIKKW